MLSYSYVNLLWVIISQKLKQVGHTKIVLLVLYGLPKQMDHIIYCKFFLNRSRPEVDCVINVSIIRV